MSIRIGAENAERIREAMFAGFGKSKAELFLRAEMERYLPQFASAEEDKIREFSDYQRSVYIDGKIPVMGRVIASLNPTFIDSLEKVRLSSGIYTRASTKENGYRMQIHNSRSPSAFTRQFTAYDLRMFPEITEYLSRLPVMIGDAELVNAKYNHLAGFNRVGARIKANHWPSRGSSMLDDKLLAEYFAREEIFNDREPIDEFRMTLAFHGLFAVSPPESWGLSFEEQLESFENLCRLPVDYEKIDGILDKLAVYFNEKQIPFRVVNRKAVNSKKELEKFVREHEKAELEGVCIVQSCRDDGFKVGKGFKIKKYETIDTALLGVYLGEKARGVCPDNLEGALLGLWDESLGCYLAVNKVNLNPNGVQVKTEGQRERLVELQKEIARLIAWKENNNPELMRLYDVYLKRGQESLRYALNGNSAGSMLDEMFSEIPRGASFMDLLELYSSQGCVAKPKTKKELFIGKYSEVFDSFMGLKNTDRRRYKRLANYFNQSKEIKTLSAKLDKPDVLLDTSNPVIIEEMVFHIKWGPSQFPAGFHTYYANSFVFENAYPERVRPDKTTTSDYPVIYDFARKNTVR